MRDDKGRPLGNIPFLVLNEKTSGRLQNGVRIRTSERGEAYYENGEPGAIDIRSPLTEEKRIVLGPKREEVLEFVVANTVSFWCSVRDERNFPVGGADIWALDRGRYESGESIARSDERGGCWVSVPDGTWLGARKAGYFQSRLAIVNRNRSSEDLALTVAKAGYVPCVRVVTEDGKFLPQAEVYVGQRDPHFIHGEGGMVVECEWPVQKRLTDVDGMATFSDCHPSRDTFIHVRKEAMAATTIPVPLARMRTSDPIIVKLKQGCSVSGRVYRANGAVPGRCLVTGALENSVVNPEARADGNGYFTITEVGMQKELSLRIYVSGRYVMNHTIDSTAPDIQAINIELK